MKHLLTKLSVITIIFIMAFALDSSNVFAQVVIQIKDGEDAWTGITASDAYDECEELNESYSTLGKASVNAHLTTNADWYAVSLLANSSYGSGVASNTTGNKSGVMNFGSHWTFTASLLDTYNANSYVKSLEDNKKGYVETVYSKSYRDSNKIGLGLRTGELLVGNEYYDDNKSYPVTTRQGLFVFNLGVGSPGCAAGASNNSITFRPVIWNN
jgi:hypothetical protein